MAELLREADLASDEVVIDAHALTGSVDVARKRSSGAGRDRELPAG